MRTMKLRPALIGYSFFVSIVPMALMLILAISIVYRTVVQRSLDELHAVGAIQKARLEEVVLSHEERLKGIQSRTQLRLSLAAYNNTKRPEDFAKIQKITKDALHSIDDFETIRIIGTDGTVYVTETKGDAIPFEFDPSQLFRFVMDSMGTLHVQMTGPFVLDDNIIGYAVVHMSARHITDIIGDYTGLGDTGETLLAERDSEGNARFIGPLRFPDNALWGNTVPKGNAEVPMTIALQGREDIFTEVVDYRGVPVYAATAYLPQLDVGIVVKMNRSEVFAPLHMLLAIMIPVLIVMMGAIVVALMWLRNEIIRPIQTLSEHASLIASGKLNTTLPQRRGDDEISVLTQSFADMRRELKALLNDLEKKVRQRTRKLRESNQFLNSVIEHIPNMIFVKDAKDLKFVRFNKAGEELVGVSKKDMLGKSDYDFFPKEQADFFVEKDREVLHGNKVVDIPEEQISTVTNGKRWLHTKKIPIKDTKGRPKFLLGISEDITEKREFKELKKTKRRLQKEAQNSKKFHQAVESAADAIVIVDKENTVVYANPAWEKLTGFSEQEVLRKKASFMDEEKSDKKEFAAMKRALKQGRSFRGEDLYHTRNNGKSYPIELTIYPIKEKGKLQFYVRIHHDITRRKRTEIAKTEFMALASHQLRTPLTALRWMFDLLLHKKGSKDLSSQQAEVLQDGYQATQNMAETIGTMLTLSRIESGRMDVQFTEVVLEPLIDSVMSDYEPLYIGKDLQVNVACKADLRVKSDGKLLREVMANLLSNAIKYTPNGGSVQVKVQQRGKSVCIDIIDSGYGIPEEEQSKIFTRFFRSRSIAGKVPDGTGLGLYLVKEVVTLLKGKVTFSSIENEGTTFRVTLPH